MKKIMVIGCGGSGKSTLSKQIHEITGIELFHLDQIYWSEGWVAPDGDIWIENNRKLIQKESWILDGNYGSTMDMRIAAADTIIFLFRPSHVCLFRVIKRTILNIGKTREDLPKGCPEKLEFQFLHYIAMYNKTRAPGILKKLELQRKNKEVYILKNDVEINDFVDQIKSRFSKRGIEL